MVPGKWAAFDDEDDVFDAHDMPVEPPAPEQVDVATEAGQLRLRQFLNWTLLNETIEDFAFVYQQFHENAQELPQLANEQLQEIAERYDQVAIHFQRRLVTKLLYDSVRHGWDAEECVRVRARLVLLDANFKGYGQKEYIRYIEKAESDERTFWGEDLSDDSDSDEESVPFNAEEEDVEVDDEDGQSHPLPSEDEDQQNRGTYRFAQKALYPGGEDIRQKMAPPVSPFGGSAEKPTLRKITEWSSKVAENATIHYDVGEWTPEVQADLEAVNLALTKGGSDVEAAAVNGTRFCIAQYRGIAYNVTAFNAAARRANRATYELLLPVYASSVFHHCGVSPAEFYAGQCDPQIAANLATTAEVLRDILLAKRTTDPITIGERQFDNQAFALQDYYTKSYDGFHRQLRLYFEAQARKGQQSAMEGVQEGAIQELWPCFEGLLNARNPFVSTGNTPRHALRYAYGLKYYDGHKHERLRPRWRASGRAERPYAGKVYISLHPVNDYLFGAPLDVVALNRSGKVSVVSLIAAERESSFPAMLPAERVVGEHIARYPSFRYKYRPYYLHKYGLRAGEYAFFRQKIVGTKPHSESNRNNKRSLGEWLARYYEARLVELARRHAKKDGMLLVYRDENGFLTRVLPAQLGPVRVESARDSSGSDSDSDGESMAASNKLSSLEGEGIELPEKEKPPKVQQPDRLSYEMFLAMERRRYEFLRWIRQRFEIHRVPGDGNCLFHALCGALPRDVLLAACHAANVAHQFPLFDGDVRSLAVWQLRNEQLFPMPPDGAIAQNVLDEMALRATFALQYRRWGTDREVGAIARALNITIRIYSPGEVNGYRYVGPGGAPAAILFHAGGDHWEWLTVRDPAFLAHNFDP